jgi:hypothetical protein
MVRKSHQNKETDTSSFKLGFTVYVCLQQTLFRHLFCFVEENEQRLEETPGLYLPEQNRVFLHYSGTFKATHFPRSFPGTFPDEAPRMGQTIWERHGPRNLGSSHKWVQWRENFTSKSKDEGMGHRQACLLAPPQRG